MLGWIKHKLQSRLPGEISIASDMQMMPPLWKKAKNWRASWKWKSKKVGLNVNIQKTKIMASGPITSWQIDGETMEAVTNFIFWGSKITVTGDCSHEIRRRLLLGRKDMTNLDSILKKQTHYFADRGPSSQSYVFCFCFCFCFTSHIWMWESDCKESWALMDAFEL